MCVVNGRTLTVETLERYLESEKYFVSRTEADILKYLAPSLSSLPLLLLLCN